MFIRSFASKDRAGKSVKTSKGSFNKDAIKTKLLEKSLGNGAIGTSSTRLTSDIVKFVVGKDQRLFAAHQDVLKTSPWMQQALKSLFYSTAPKASQCIDLSDEEPETFSCVLEYLYKGDYTPRLIHDKRRNVWYIEGQSQHDAQFASPTFKGGQPMSATMYHGHVGDVILRDTAVYCAAERFGLEPLKQLAMRKQGLQSGIEVATILRSMRFAYAHTPDTDNRLRAHYLALIVRSRKTFKRSGTMQAEMTRGGSMFFDLFVAMCNHLDDVTVSTPRTV